MTDEHDCDSCDSGSCSAAQRMEGEADEAFQQRQKLARQMKQIKQKIVILSGKGGVGKSTVAVNLALSLARAGQKVGLLDVDLHGPTVPELLKLSGQTVQIAGQRLVPARYENLKVMSVGLMLRSREDAVIWRGPMKIGVIRQFLTDTAWGELDCLVIDCPPGTGDEPLSVVQLIEDLTGAVVVTTPQQVALADVRRSITFCRQLKLPVLGVVENMSGFVCPKCGEKTDIFRSGGGQSLAEEMGVPFLGRIPIDPYMVWAGENKEPFVIAYPDSETAEAFREIVAPFIDGTITGKAESAQSCCSESKE
jgi:ATP-binding protein involved in chromosome partitioning